MSKIRELINDKDSILVFDVDGVLAPFEYDEYRHAVSDEKWDKLLSSTNPYSSIRPIKIIQDFLKNKDMNNIYVVTKIYNENEIKCKIEFLNNNYNIKKDNILSVKKNEDKLKRLWDIKSKYPKLEDYKIVMIDDSLEVLDYIMKYSNFSTMHVSSFF